MRKVIVGALGLPVWLLAQLMGLGGAGGGDGWIGGFWFSIPLLVLYPLVLIRAFASEREKPEADLIIVGVGAVLDFFLLANMAEELEYVAKLWSFDRSGMILWLALWAGWQVIGLTSVVRNRNSRIQASSASA
jgi:hypothetical protein